MSRYPVHHRLSPEHIAKGKVLAALEARSRGRSCSSASVRVVGQQRRDRSCDPAAGSGPLSDPIDLRAGTCNTIREACLDRPRHPRRPWPRITTHRVWQLRCNRPRRVPAWLFTRAEPTRPGSQSNPRLGRRRTTKTLAGVGDRSPVNVSREPSKWRCWMWPKGGSVAGGMDVAERTQGRCRHGAIHIWRRWRPWPVRFTFGDPGGSPSN